jgi:cytochrome c556
MRALRLSVGLAALCLAACGKPAAPPATDALESVATVRQLMLGLVVPASDSVFQVGADESAEAAEWEKIQASAAMLAEAAKLLLDSTRSVGAEDWTRYSRDLHESALAAARALDAEKVLEAGDRIYAACEGCHEKYLPSAASD